MHFRLILGAIGFASAFACAVTFTFVVFEMVDKVNEGLPGDRQFVKVGWYWSKYRRLIGEYKRLCPNGVLHRKLLALATVMFISGVICAWGIGIFGR
jgi:hypothetical protein